MLPFDFDYYLPDTLNEAVDIFTSIQKEGKKPLYYSGGTEIISMGRVFNIVPDAVIDIKKIPECGVMGTDGTQLVFGSALTLNSINKSGLFKLLGLACGRIADHTIQCKLTLGGNLAGTIRYHETFLPLVLADSVIHIASAKGIRQVPIAGLISNGVSLSPGELLVKVTLDNKFASLPCAHIKKSKTEKIGYPLISLSAINVQNTMRLAASGLTEYPFRFPDILFDEGQTPADITRNITGMISSPVFDDIEGCAAYRRFIFERTTENIIRELKNNEVTSIA